MLFVSYLRIFADLCHYSPIFSSAVGSCLAPSGARISPLKGGSFHLSHLNVLSIWTWFLHQVRERSRCVFFQKLDIQLDIQFVWYHLLKCWSSPCYTAVQISRGTSHVWLECWNFQSRHRCSPRPTSGEGQGAGDWITSDQWFDQPCLCNEASITTQKDGVQELPGWWHMEVWGECDMQWGHRSSMLLPTYLVLFICFIWLLLNK